MSTLKVTNIQATGETASRAVSGVAAAWVNFDGTGTIATRDSSNVASLTDNGTGDYQINISSAISSSNYYVGESGATNTTSEIRHYNTLTRTTTAVQIQCRDNNGNPFVDTAYAGVSIHGDLA